MPPLRAGVLRSRVTLQAKAAAPDGQGGTTNVWGTVATVWAKVTPADMSGDAAEADGVVSRRKYTITIRRRADVTSAMRVLRNATQLLEITSVIASDEDRSALLLECREVLPDVTPVTYDLLYTGGLLL